MIYMLVKKEPNGIIFFSVDIIHSNNNNYCVDFDDRLETKRK